MLWNTAGVFRPGQFYATEGAENFVSSLFTRFWVSLCKKSVETPEWACRLLKQWYNNNQSTHPGAPDDYWDVNGAQVCLNQHE